MTLSLFRFGPVLDRVWAFAQMGLARPGLARLDGLSFWKLLGAGSGEGFTPIPDTGLYAILCVWRDRAAADAGLTAPVFRRYTDRARETGTLRLTALSSRGEWAGRTPFAEGAHGDGPIAALTRATVKPRNLWRFWRRVPDISRMIGANDDVRLKIGVGEVPFLHQVTFSIWPDAEAMAAFARRSGPHAAAIRAVRDGDWFAEELYARFRVTGATGRWQGRPIQEVLQ